MAIVAIIVGLSVNILNSVRRSRGQVGCAANLKAIGHAFQLYVQAYQGVYPAPTSEAQWEELLREYVPRSTFNCPSDYELYASLGSSYDWRDTGDPETTLAGRPITSVVRNNVSVAFDALPGWHAPGKVQVLLSGGDIQMLTDRDFFQELQRSPAKP